MNSVTVLMFLWSLTGVNGFKVKSGHSKVSKHWNFEDQRSQVPGGSLSFKVTGNGKLSPDKSSGTLELQLVANKSPKNFDQIGEPNVPRPGFFPFENDKNSEGNNPGYGPTGAPTEGFGSSTTGGFTEPTQGKSYKQGEFSSFEMEGLETHNAFREIHNAPPLSLDKRMCQEAAEYAQKLARMGTLQHDPPPGEGENLSMGCRSGDRGGQTAKEAVTNWYNEVCKPGYSFGRSGYQGGTGHFTQVVWKASEVLGIGKADSRRMGMQCTYIVGRYKPQGNFDTGNDDYRKNVLKGSFERSYCNTLNNNPSGFRDKVYK